MEFRVQKALEVFSLNPNPLLFSESLSGMRPLKACAEAEELIRDSSPDYKN
jgi:hypothetical protein